MADDSPRIPQDAYLRDRHALHRMFRDDVELADKRLLVGRAAGREGHGDSPDALMC